MEIDGDNLRQDERRQVRRRNLRRYVHTQSFNRLAHNAVLPQRPESDYAKARLALLAVAALMLTAGLVFVVF